MPEKEIYKIRLVEFRLDPEKMVECYNTRYLPILGKNDPLALRLTRDSHVEDSFLPKIHLPVRTSVRNLCKGKYGVLYPNARSY